MASAPATDSAPPTLGDLFHPAVAGWFEERFGAATEPQLAAWPAIAAGTPTLIAAPTGSGKTLAAFLSVLDRLVRRGLSEGLPERTLVLYVSPLKALSNDVEKNLQEPLAGIREHLERQGLEDVDIRTWVRSGDTPASERTAMLRHPPHVLVTTPESLYILLGSDGGRGMLTGVETVIVDEIHAIVDGKRGSHLSLSLERLGHLTERKPLRIGLSATQRPIELVARFLFGDDDCRIVDCGHRRRLDLAIEMPSSPLEAVMSNEVWDEIYDRVAALVAEHRTTLVFVNTRRLAERAAKHLSERLGKEHVASHHGSLAREQRLHAEERLKQGKLKALVATASLELGIDIGDVDLVCQLGTTQTIAQLLQRVGRSGHTLRATPKGRLFPLTRDELIEAMALLRSIDQGKLDALRVPRAPLDIMAQQIVAAVAAEDWREDDLYELVRGAASYRGLSRQEFDAIIAMLADGFSTRMGRRGAYLHRDRVNGMVRARRSARLAAIQNGGAIPDTADYDVILEPGETRIGSVNEDFAIESMAGHIFQLGNNSWRILRIESGRVRVQDAEGQPPTIPFWFGEAPARGDELCMQVSSLRQETAAALEQGGDPATTLAAIPGVHEAAVRQAVDYLSAAHGALGTLPSADTLVLERFFDESGGMQLVLHSPLGSRINRAWGLALRKRFCRKFNFELQAAATEDAIVLSLGVTHSFPLHEVFTYLHPSSVRHVLVQAVLDAPVFGVHWRWNAARALAILRQRGSRRVPPQIQRMNAEDLIAVVFPDQLACLENIVGEREVPEHPLVEETLRDCLEEVMDIEGLEALLQRIHDGQIELVSRDLSEPSPLAQEVLTARPYAFLDDVPLEERRTQAVYSRRWLDPATAADIGALDSAAVEAVRDEAWPRVESVEELHDALVLAGFVTAEEAAAGGKGRDRDWRAWIEELVASGRVAAFDTASRARLWVAAERLAELRAALPGGKATPDLDPPPGTPADPTPEGALAELLRGRLEILGPVTLQRLTAPLGIDPGRARAALLTLEGEGFAMRGSFSSQGDEEWCERRLLARIHRRTLRRLRSEIQPLSREAFYRFLTLWQRVAGSERLAGPAGVAAVAEQLEGLELPAAAWEEEVLPQRVGDYDREWLDQLCRSGRYTWQRRSPASELRTAGGGPLRSSPMALLGRGRLALWRWLGEGAHRGTPTPPAGRVLETLRRRGALFFEDLAGECQLLDSQLETCLAELAAIGAVTCDSFLGLRLLLTPVSKRQQGAARAVAAGFRSRRAALAEAGRWAALEDCGGGNDASSPVDPEVSAERLEEVALLLLRRWGVIFRALLARESQLPPWRDLLRVLRRLEARGEIRGGRFVTGTSGEQFALPEAVALLRKQRRIAADADPVWLSLSGADPLNLIGILTPGARLPAITGNRFLLRDGRPVATLVGGRVELLEAAADDEQWRIEARLRRTVAAETRARERSA